MRNVLVAFLVAFATMVTLGACDQAAVPESHEEAIPEQMVYVLEPRTDFVDSTSIGLPVSVTAGEGEGQWVVVHEIVTTEGVSFTGWDYTPLDSVCNPTIFHVHGRNNLNDWGSLFGETNGHWGGSMYRDGSVFDDLVAVCNSRHPQGHYGIIPVKAPPVLRDEIRGYLASP